MLGLFNKTDSTFLNLCDNVTHCLKMKLKLRSHTQFFEVATLSCVHTEIVARKS